MIFIIQFISTFFQAKQSTQYDIPSYFFPFSVTFRAPNLDVNWAKEREQSENPKVTENTSSLNEESLEI